MKPRNRTLACFAAIGALACVPAAAQAGTVSVEEVAGTTNQSILRFAAGPGEQNKITVKQGPTTPGVTVALEVSDAGAPLVAGPGCTGGGSAGSTASCTLHAGRPSAFEACGHDCVGWIPGTAWQTSMRIELGDGNDSFDGSSLTGSYTEGWEMAVDGGTGDDTILTGGSRDNDHTRPGQRPRPLRR